VTVLVPEALRRAVDGIDYPALATGTGAVLVVLLIAMLVELQLVEASRRRAGGSLRAFAVPLLLAFCFVAVLRVVELLAAHS
jgi:hypothetical protein